MKICIYNLTTGIIFGGVEVFSMRVAEMLAKQGEEVYLFTGRGKILLPFSPSQSLRIKKYHYLPHRFIPDLGTRFKKFISRTSFGAFSIADLCRERFDIIHIQKPYDLPAACLVKAVTGAKIILSSHGTDFYFGDILFAKGIDSVFSCSSFNAAEIWEHYRLKARVIYNGCNVELFRPMEPDRILKEKLGIRDESVLCTAGRLVNWKRIDILIRAFSLIKAKNSRLIICGEGEDKNNLLKLSRALGVHDRIIWPGRILHEELPRYFSLADVFVQPSISESFGMSICEAMAMEVPVVASRSGGVPEVVDDQKNGFLVEPGDINKIVEGIDTLLSDKTLRKDMGREGRQKVLRLFTWEKVTERIREGYREVLKKK